MVNEFHIRAQLERRLASWPAALGQRIQVCFPDAKPGVTPDETLLTALSDETRTTLARVTLAHIALHGKYPKPQAAQRIRALLAAHGALPALKLLLELDLGKSGRRRHAIRPAETVIDVTRYVEEYTRSGIPRVVGNILSSEQFRSAEAIVWDDGAPCPVQRGVSSDGAGVLKFTKANWGRPHQRARILGKLHALLTEYRFLLVLVTAASALLRKLILRNAFASRKPKFVLVLDDSKLLMPEVPAREVSQLVENAVDSFAQLESTLIIHDLLPLNQPQFFEDDSVLNHVYLARLAAKCTRLIAATPIIEREMTALAELVGYPAPEIQKMMLPVSMNTPTPNQEGEQGLPYFVFMGGFDPRKGLQQLIDHLSFYDPAYLNFRIVVVGAPNATQGALQLAAALKRKQSLFEIRRQINDQSLADLIFNSCGVLYPSFAEGYGLPVLEAVSLGVPVLVRETPTNLWLAQQFEGIDTGYTETSDDLVLKLQQMVASARKWDQRSLPDFPNSLVAWVTSLHEIIHSSSSKG